MPFVIDVSLMAVWHFPDERNSTADAALARLEHEGAVVPLIWWFEVRQVLLKGERRGRTSPEQSAQFLAFLDSLPLRVAPLPVGDAVMQLARRHQLSFYDAAYLELAQRERIGLATLDAALVRAASAEGVALVGA
ncbi:type II toxin-antitoxin system VapC family toxin [Rhodopseudomonas palustris]|uniref:type II toxin-antitoxin system VapC family toxin n=1 Tax=Rhodopseudomonas palustris TaxID=1076 RepID=UPI00115C9D8A|nr:type II toxin-antitoxin system VapC family toxin [Rhodopseudomonas palustris]QDL99613.1 type II toxin-antitoxin system VapC family toxin [Rhodopseudomonas palustris]